MTMATDKSCDYYDYYGLRTVLRNWWTLSHVILSVNHAEGNCWYPHFTDEQSEAQRASLAFISPHRPNWIRCSTSKPNIIIHQMNPLPETKFPVCMPKSSKRMGDAWLFCRELARNGMICFGSTGERGELTHLYTTLIPLILASNIYPVALCGWVGGSWQVFSSSWDPEMIRLRGAAMRSVIDSWIKEQ